MSLIHDALKKLERTSTVSSPKPPPFAGTIGESEHRPSRRRLIFFGALFVVALLFFAATRWSNRQPLPVATSNGERAADGSRSVTDAEAERLGTEAVDAYRAGDLETAWAKCSAAASLAPHHPEILNNLGLVAKKRGDIQRAREAWEKALELQPTCVACLNNLALLDRSAGNAALARVKLEKAIALDPTHPEAHFHLGLIAEESGDHALAVRWYTQFLKLSPNLPPHVIEQLRDHVLDIE